MMLAEVLVSTAVFAVVLVGTLALLDVGAKIAPQDQEERHAIREAQGGLERMVGELRQAYRVVGTSPSSMRVLVRIKKDDPGTTAVESHVNRTVEYDCGVAVTGRCVRREAPVGQVLPSSGEVVIDRVLNSEHDATDSSDRPVFSFEQASDEVTPTYVKVRIVVPASGERTIGAEHDIVLEDGFFSRNLKT